MARFDEVTGERLDPPKPKNDSADQKAENAKKTAASAANEAPSKGRK